MTSTENNLHYFTSTDGLRLCYRDYGRDRAGTPVVCLPGLTRNSRDFEELASRISARRRVIAVDFRGRGHSDHDPDWRNYHPGTYVNDTLLLLDNLGIERFIVVGTSLGGLCAMQLAAITTGRVSGVVINDICPEVNPGGLARIKEYTGKLPPVSSWDEALQQTRDIYLDALPGLSDAEWRKMAWCAYRDDENGVPALDMDPSIGTAIREIGPQTGDPWSNFDALATVPTVVIWGQLSDILTQDQVEKVTARRTDIEIVPVPNRGHVPLLNEPECVAAIDRVLERVR